MTDTPPVGSAPGEPAAPAQQNTGSPSAADSVAQANRMVAQVEQALKDMRDAGERLRLGMRRTALLAGVAGGIGLALVVVSAGIWARSAAHLAAASDAQNAAAMALVDRIVRVEALADRIETAQQATQDAAPDLIGRIGGLQDHIDAGLGTLGQGLARMGEDLAAASTGSTEALETRVLAAIADVGVAVARLNAGSSTQTQPAELAALVARLERAVAAAERGAGAAPARASQPSAATAPAQRAARPQRPPAPNPYSFP